MKHQFVVVMYTEPDLCPIRVLFDHTFIGKIFAVLLCQKFVLYFQADSSGEEDSESIPELARLEALFESSGMSSLGFPS